MVYPKKAKHTAEVVAADSVGTDQIVDDAVTAAKILETADVVVDTITCTSGVITKYGTHTGVALADLTATFGDPAGLTNGTVFTYKNTTDSKVYLVAVVNGGFAIEELTAVAA